MRISDWSSDLCSSDLPLLGADRIAVQRIDHRIAPVGMAGIIGWQHHQYIAIGRLAFQIALDRGGVNLDVLDRHRLCPGDRRRARSEEHTSELQSLMRISYAVFCLKKKRNNT